MSEELEKTLRSEPSQLRSTVPAEARADTRKATVLPRVEWKGDQPQVSPPTRERYEELGRLGQGGMGEVVLIRDHDIERTVALKRLPEQCDLDLVLRFAEEIRAVGQLEHPNIMPVHDVGIDDRGRYFFVMKHLQGETLESIITKLRAGDPAAHAAYPFAVRLQLFLGVLNAMSYAHKQGFIHRDLKPANIMVGPFGEVTVMDWGLAKRIRAPEVAVPSRPAVDGGAPSGAASQRAGSALATAAGSLMGTPLFMSPEQARGEHDLLDERSDIYALGAIFYELIFLEHYLAHVERCTDLRLILDGVQTHTPRAGPLAPHHPTQPMPPAELGWYAARAMTKEKAGRHQSTDEMVSELQRIIGGRVRVQCPRTLMKRVAVELTRATDAHPLVAMVAWPLLLAAVTASLVSSLLTLLR